jgi:hypothetical protein
MSCTFLPLYGLVHYSAFMVYLDKNIGSFSLDFLTLVALYAMNFNGIYLLISVCLSAVTQR